VGWAETKLIEIGTAVEFQAERTRQAFAAGMAETQRSLRLQGALSRPIVPNALNYGSGGRLVGWSLRAAGGDVVINLRDGHDTGGDVIATIPLANGTSQTFAAPVSGISFAESLYAEVTGAGAAGVVGAVWLGAVD
jgi:hypothetical protein